MKTLGKYWRIILAFVLVAAAAFVHFRMHVPAKNAHDAEKAELNTQIATLQTAAVENREYASVQELLEPSLEEIAASRQELYSNFPVELREEDQILYMLYLEEKFGNEVVFDFAEAETIAFLQDGSMLQGATITFAYETTYDGFKEMVNELATDSRITSVRYATFEYNAEEDMLSGDMTVTLYLLQDSREYSEPEVDAPDVGKDNPFMKK